MLRAFHKKTGKFYWAENIMNLPSLIPFQQDEWIAPEIEIFNMRDLRKKGKVEVKVIFVKSHLRDNGDGTFQKVCAYFRLYDEEAVLNPNNETEEHKIAKQGIYEALINGELLIAGNFLSNFKIKDISIEHRLTSNRNSKIADVILEFEEFHQIYGKGIIFEIQFSHQNIEKEDTRTFDRITEGYSIIWLKEEDFESHNRKLKKSDIYPIPFFKALKEYQQINENKFNERIIEMMQKANVESYKIKKDIESAKSRSLIEIRDLYNQAQEGMTKRVESIKEQIELEVKEYAKKKYDEAINQMTKSIESKIDYNLVSRNIFSMYKSNISKELNELHLVEANKILSEKANQITSEIMKEFILKKAEETIKKSGGIIVHNIAICNSCRKEVDINCLEFEGGSAYCNDCFNKLPINWKKKFYLEEKESEICQSKLK